MEALLTALRDDKEVRNVEEAWGGRKRKALVYGLEGSQRRAVFAAAYSANPRAALIICSDSSEIDAWSEDLQFLLPQVPVLKLPETDTASFQAAASSVESLAKRMEVLGHLFREEPVIVLAEPIAVAQKGMTRREFEQLSLVLKTGEQMEREILLQRLVDMGYTHEPEVEHVGQFSARGGIVDIFPLNALAPVRLEFFDDEIDSLREYSLDTGRSVAYLQELDLLPLSGRGQGSGAECCLDFLMDGTVVLEEPARLRDELQRRFKEEPEEKKKYLGWEDFLQTAMAHNTLFMTTLLQKLHGADPDELIHVKARKVMPYQRQMELLTAEVQAHLKDGARVVFLLQDEQKARNFSAELNERNLMAGFAPCPGKLTEGTAVVAQGTLLNGFELPAAKLVVIAEKDVTGRQKKAARPFKAVTDSSRKIKHFSEINVGDYVVHVEWGIGKYEGVITSEIDGIKYDMFQIRYGNNDTLRVPVEDVGLLQKYIAQEGTVPKLSRLGSSKWRNTKEKARASVMDIAKELLEVGARRRQSGGFAFPPDGVEQRDFEEAFEYTETPDQLTAIEEIKRDMERPQPMDRLLCGDVGFGKTEVAIRAAYKAVLSGNKQVAVLVPTTVLAMQHYQTFKERLDGMGVEVEVICRFNSAKEQRETLKRLEAGRVDVLIGTHSLLNDKNVKFKDLGLLVIDEEQRFGVKQKEKIKKMAVGVDVLTLSATPIPRTLHMSLSGARDISIIETPPSERMPVQTYVVEDDDEILAKAIRREMRRGGQIYFVYNRVMDMEKMYNRLQKLIPEARISVGHGKMTGVQLERVMMDFYNGDVDILLATTIMENGLDVPNANTIIVYNADNFGLSQLYQMRGRVGRSSRMAFAYFVYQQDKVLTELAEKRLQAMMEFASLGSGFKIAMRDLELRGAGDILGSSQHGHIEGVGFELYCQMLDEAVHSLQSGEPVRVPTEPSIELGMEAYLEAEYIGEALHKLEIYRRLNAVRDNDELSAVVDEMIDRFGEPPEATQRLLQAVRIKNYARLLGIERVTRYNDELTLKLSNEHKVAGENVARLYELLQNKLKMLPEENLMRIKLPGSWIGQIEKVALGVMRCLNGEITGKQPEEKKNGPKRRK